MWLFSLHLGPILADRSTQAHRYLCGILRCSSSFRRWKQFCLRQLDSRLCRNCSYIANCYYRSEGLRVARLIRIFRINTVQSSRLRFLGKCRCRQQEQWSNLSKFDHSFVHKHLLPLNQPWNQPPEEYPKQLYSNFWVHSQNRWYYWWD